MRQSSRLISLSAFLAFVIVLNSAGAQTFAKYLHVLDLIRDDDGPSRLELHTFVVGLLGAPPSSYLILKVETGRGLVYVCFSVWRHD